MLEVNGIEADNIQYYIFHLFMDARELLNCVEQFIFLTKDENWNQVEKIYENYNNLFNATISGIRYEIIVGTTKLSDTNGNAISVPNFFNYCWKLDNDNFKEKIREFKTELKEYNKLLKDIQTIRNKIYAHTDFKFNTAEVDKFGECMLEQTQLEELKDYLKLVIKICLEMNKLHKNGEMRIDLISIY